MSSFDEQAQHRTDVHHAALKVREAVRLTHDDARTRILDLIHPDFAPAVNELVRAVDVVHEDSLAPLDTADLDVIATDKGHDYYDKSGKHVHHVPAGEATPPKAILEASQRDVRDERSEEKSEGHFASKPVVDDPQRTQREEETRRREDPTIVKENVDRQKANQLGSGTVASQNVNAAKVPYTSPPTSSPAPAIEPVGQLNRDELTRQRERDQRDAQTRIDAERKRSEESRQAELNRPKAPTPAAVPYTAPATPPAPSAEDEARKRVDETRRQDEERRKANLNRPKPSY